MMFEFELPEGMSTRDFLAHPVRQLIRHAAYVGKRAIPNTAELDALRLEPRLRTRVRDACLTVAQIHDAGEHETAWNLGDEEAAWVLAKLSDEQRDPRFYEPIDPADVITDSGQLAALVPRGIS